MRDRNVGRRAGDGGCAAGRDLHRARPGAPAGRRRRGRRPAGQRSDDARRGDGAGGRRHLLGGGSDEAAPGPSPPDRRRADGGGHRSPCATCSCWPRPCCGSTPTAPAGRRRCCRRQAVTAKPEQTGGTNDTRAQTSSGTSGSGSSTVVAVLSWPVWGVIIAGKHEFTWAVAASALVPLVLTLAVGGVRDAAAQACVAALPSRCPLARRAAARQQPSPRIGGVAETAERSSTLDRASAKTPRWSRSPARR